MTATLDGAQQVPPVDTPGKGTAEVTFDTETKKLDWTVEYSVPLRRAKMPMSRCRLKAL